MDSTGEDTTGESTTITVEQSDPTVSSRVLAVVAAADLIDETVISWALDIAPTIVRQCLDAAAAAGLLRTTSPYLSLAHRQKILDSTDDAVVGLIHGRALDRLSSGADPGLATAEALVQSGCHDARLVDHLLNALHDTDEADRPHLLEVIDSAGADPIDVAGHLAQVAAAAGDFEASLRFSEVVLSHPDHPAVLRAARAAAVAHAHRGMTQMSATVCDLIGTEHVSDTTTAVWAFLGNGDPQAAGDVPAPDQQLDPTSTGRGMAMLTQGLELSLIGDGSSALPILVQSVTALQPVGNKLVMPDSPAAIAALSAIGLGELDTAESVLLSALAADLGGTLLHSRHRLLLAWVSMMRNDLASASQIVDEVIAAEAIGRRDAFMVHALRVGIARRNADLADLDARWNEARFHLPEFSIDLYSLLTLGELAVAAARLRESYRLRTHLADAELLLDRLGRPPLWSAMHHWYGVHAAILAEDPAAMIPHADALVHSAEISRVASSLATAGQTWLRVLQGDIDVTTVRRGVSALEQVGLAWGAQHLAAQAAARTPDRQAMLELMQVARASHRTSTNDQRPTTSGEAESSASHLTEREWEVATMVVDGLNYRGIGERLFISPKTVEHHVARIRRRLGAESRQDMLAALRGLMAADDPGIDGEISQSGR